MNIDWPLIEKTISDATGSSFSIISTQQVSGGDINTAYVIQGRASRYFVKINRPQLVAMFEAELAGLVELAESDTVKVPVTIACDSTEQFCFLILEGLELKPLNNKTEQLLGQQLADLHIQQQNFFGWQRDNTIGLTPQYNKRNDSWIEFWREQRLNAQLKFAAEKGYTGQLQNKGEQLGLELDKFFTDYQPQASLLHGDLWAGNAAADEFGQPVIYDPACYFGDREADIAMTELFGGYGENFYAAYNDVFPLDSGYGIRKTLYNLYHILNHLNLFGSAYQGQALRMLDSLLAEV